MRFFLLRSIRSFSIIYWLQTFVALHSEWCIVLSLLRCSSVNAFFRRFLIFTLSPPSNEMQCVNCARAKRHKVSECYPEWHISTWTNMKCTPDNAMQREWVWKNCVSNQKCNTTVHVCNLVVCPIPSHFNLFFDFVFFLLFFIVRFTRVAVSRTSVCLTAIGRISRGCVHSVPFDGRQ